MLGLEAEGGSESIYKELKTISVPWKAKGTHGRKGMGDGIAQTSYRSCSHSSTMLQPRNDSR